MSNQNLHLIQNNDASKLKINTTSRYTQSKISIQQMPGRSSKLSKGKLIMISTEKKRPRFYTDSINTPTRIQSQFENDMNHIVTKATGQYRGYKIGLFHPR